MLYSYDFCYRRYIIVLSMFFVLFYYIVPLQFSFAAPFDLNVNTDIFMPKDALVVYGKGFPNDVLVFRLYDPTGKAIRIESIPLDSDGYFKKQIFTWPTPSRNVAYGQYVVEINSSFGTKDNRQIPVNFVKGSGNNISALPHSLIVKLECPSEVPVGRSFRVFVQVTFDSALVNSDPSKLLGSSHIHSGNMTLNLGKSFTKLHEGIYYADVVLDAEGSYIIHASAYDNGYLSHDSRVVAASKTTISSIQESVNDLSIRLNSTNSNVVRLDSKLSQTDSSLNDTRILITNSLDDARVSIKQDIDSAKTAVSDISQASGQTNAMILPILALISVIIALQISLFARIRASYR